MGSECCAITSSMNTPIDGAAILARLRDEFPELNALPRDVYIVGGAVRDAILGNKPLDIDLASRDARETARQFQKQTGGTLVDLGRERFATFRVVTGPRIYDFNEIIGANIEEDLQRRDFTINAAALEAKQGRLIDPANAVRDTKGRILRMVREENFRDDPLRVLKGVRMVVLYRLTVEPATLEAMKRHAGSVRTVAAERIAYELALILSAPGRGGGLELLHQLNLDRQLLGFEITPVDIDRIARLAGADVVTVWAALMLDREDFLESVAERWRWSDRQKRDTRAAITLARQAPVRGAEEWPLLIYDYGLESSHRAAELLGVLKASGEFGAMVNSEGERIVAITSLLDGDQIQAIAGIPPGPQVGQFMRALLVAQIRGTVRTSEEAISFIRRSRTN